MRLNTIFRIVLLAILGCCVSAAAGAGEGHTEKVTLPARLFDNIDPTESIKFFSSLDTRLTGTTGCDEAADFIRARFEQIGLDNIQEQTFSVPVPLDRGSSLTLGDTTYEIHGMWPNLGRAPKTISEGLGGYLVYGGIGETTQFDGISIDGAVVLMDFNCSLKWLNVAQFNAAAIIFIEPLSTFRKEAEDKFLQIPASIQRYYITRAELARLLEKLLGRSVGQDELPAALASLNVIAREHSGITKQINRLPKDDTAATQARRDALVMQRDEIRKNTEVLVKADILWQNQTGRNIIGTIIGTDPTLRKETVIIESFYDSTSVVPAIAPGAESSCGIAALLEVAAAFRANPPKRTVRFLATSGHFQALAGMRSWCRQYWVWETLMVAHKIGIDNPMFAPPAEIWPTKEETAALKQDETQPEWKPTEHPIIYASLDISSLTNQMGIFFKGNFYDIGGQAEEAIYRKKFSDIGHNTITAYETSIRKLAGVDTDFVSCIDLRGARDWRSYVIGSIALNNEVPLIYGKAGIGFVTVNDSRPSIDTPLDTFERLEPNLDTVRQQAKLVTGLLWDVSTRSYPIQAPDAKVSEAYVAVSEDSLINFLPGAPLNDALVGIWLNSAKSIAGVRGIAMTFSNQEGRALITGWHKPNEGVPYTVFKIDPKDGSIAFTARKGLVYPRWPAITGKEWELTRASDGTLPVFECSATLMFDLVDQLNYRTLTDAEVLLAASDTPPRNSAVFVGASSASSSYSEPCCVAFAERGDERVKFIIKAGGFAGSKFTLLNATGSDTPAQAYGVGFPSEKRENVLPYTTYFAAHDMWMLNEYRLEKLRRTGVRNERASWLHDELARKKLFAPRDDDGNLIEDDPADPKFTDAESALGRLDYTTFLNSAREAWAYEARAYPSVLGTADDVIKGLIFYLAVLLPFAVFAERLFFAFADIRKRLIGVAVMFAAIYIVLSQVHPGFKLTSTPIIILAGFFMLMLGLITTGILLNKFNTQMALIREKSGVWHRQDVARGSAAGAAFMLGISNLRRRKVRTLLTCLTLVLLTFTVLSFTSFETSVAPNEIPTNYTTRYKGLLIRRRDWSPIENYAGTTLREYFAMRKGIIAERSWYSGDPDASDYMQLDVVNADDPARFLPVRGLLGLDPQENQLIPFSDYSEYGDWFDPSAKSYPQACILPLELAEGPVSKDGLNDFLKSVSFPATKQDILKHAASVSAKDNITQFIEKMPDGRSYKNAIEVDETGGLGITRLNFRNARVKLFGRELRVAGVMNSAKFRQIKDLDGEELTPVDYKRQAADDLAKGKPAKALTVSETGELQAQGEQKPPEQYQHIDPATIVLMPNAFIQNFNQTTSRSIAVGMETGEKEITELLRHYVPRSRLILFAGLDLKGTVKLFSSRDALTAKGMQALFLPIAIAALIVFNTMLGSVYERLREIAVYTSCGLAPVHVAALFLAESSVFATMGAVVGYLFGQGVAKVVTISGKLEGINLNYSSVSAVYTIILVVVVVLLSTLYPARKAVQLSVPDETKKMKLPKPKGDVWEFDFPFTVSRYEALGLNAFIHDYFASHDEDSGGVFCSGDTSLKAFDETHGTRYVLLSTIWVEPMDMGISQRVVLETLPPQPTDPICTIKFTIHRLSGEVETWRRMNLGFLKAIRKQMLIWRLVDAEHKAQYDQQGNDLLAKSVEV